MLGGGAQLAIRRRDHQQRVRHVRKHQAAADAGGDTVQKIPCGHAKQPRYERQWGLHLQPPGITWLPLLEQGHIIQGKAGGLLREIDVTGGAGERGGRCKAQRDNWDHGISPDGAVSSRWARKRASVCNVVSRA